MMNVNLCGLINEHNKEYKYGVSMAYEWSRYPDKKPIDTGYYLTLYWNSENQGYFDKCIKWDGIEWQSWRPGAITDADVKGFVLDTLNPFYVPCMRNANANVKDYGGDMFSDLFGSSPTESESQDNE